MKLKLVCYLFLGYLFNNSLINSFYLLKYSYTIQLIKCGLI